MTSLCEQEGRPWPRSTCSRAWLFPNARIWCHIQRWQLTARWNRVWRHYANISWLQSLGYGQTCCRNTERTCWLAIIATILLHIPLSRNCFPHTFYGRPSRNTVENYIHKTHFNVGLIIVAFLLFWLVILLIALRRERMRDRWSNIMDTIIYWNISLTYN